jgi:multiple antibiotic resistance protein
MEQTADLGVLASKLFPLLFNMMGPIGLIPAFAALSAGMSEDDRTAMARRAANLAFISLIVAVFVGASMLSSWSISNGSLIFAGGLIVTLTALLPIVSSGRGESLAPSGHKQTPQQLAVTPLAFPTIVSPRAVAILIIFVAYFPTIEGKLTVVALAALIMMLNLFGMRYAQAFMEKVGMTPLVVLGAVFGVLQVALGVEMMANGWQAWASPAQ